MYDFERREYPEDDPYLIKLRAHHEARMKPLRFIANLWCGVIVFGMLMVSGTLLWAAWQFREALIQ